MPPLTQGFLQIVTKLLTTSLTNSFLSKPGYVDSTFLYDLNLKTWSNGPSLNIARYGHSCGLINWLNPATDEQEQVVVVAGGYNGQLLSSSELLFVNNFESGFSMGPVIPRPVSLSEMIQFENGVIVVGGGYGSGNLPLTKKSIDSGKFVIN